MGKTVPSFRMALEFEFERWKGFKKALTSIEDLFSRATDAKAAIILLALMNAVPPDKGN
jgi:hypothetical protein